MRASLPSLGAAFQAGRNDGMYSVQAVELNCAKGEMKQLLRTILLVDDDAAYAYSAEKALTVAGFRVVVAGEFSAALRVLENERVDLLLVDVQMPGQPHGFALARMARRRVPSLPVVYMTAYPDLAESERETALGEIVEKRLGIEVVIEQIQHAIKGTAGSHSPG